MSPGKIIGSEQFNYYMSLVTGDVLSSLERQLDTTSAVFESISEEKGGYRYAAGKWSIKEMIGHMCDAERIFAYRALRFARNDQTPLSPFEQDDYVIYANSDARSVADLADEFRLIRKSTIALFRSFDREMMERSGTTGTVQLTVENLLYIICGHELHHIGVLRRSYGIA
jgi:uncharacterized damage-inducible protein DinB